MNAFVKAAVFTVAICVSYIYIGIVITDISGGSKTGAKIEGVNPEAGEQIFWSNGKCHTCHSIGTKGSAIRAPNLGVLGNDFPLPIALRAEERAKELGAKLGKTLTATDYIVSSHYDPGLYVVQGYKNEMPTPWKPPIALTVDELLAVDLYLQTLGGDPNQEAVMASPFYVAMKEAAGRLDPSAVVAFKPYLEGDPERGMELFFDPNSKTPCGKCHTVGERGGKVGPELTNVAGTRDIHYIIESVLDPSAVIVGGFEQVLILTEDDDLFAAILKSEDEENLVLVNDDGEEIVFPKDEIARMKEQTKSMMPDNFRELLSVEEFHDLLAFLQTLQ